MQSFGQPHGIKAPGCRVKTHILLKTASLMHLLLILRELVGCFRIS